MPFNTLTVATAVTPGVIETYFSHFINRKQLRQKPTAHISYHEGLQLVRHFLEYASRNTVEDLQAFTAQYVPSPTWIRVNDEAITAPFIDRAADVLRAQFGDAGLEKIGGKSWWLWRRPNAALRAEWIEMKKDYNERKRKGEKGERVIFYIHGGAYYFGSVDEHRYQLQRHARKLNARMLAPRYRLAPQFPFPCGLLDCLASYFFLLELYDTSSIIVAGDSAGGGMSLSMLCVLRDQKQPLPAGTILLSPWVDLTHSFPSLASDPSLDYIPPWGFVHKPSMAWPPVTQEPATTATANGGSEPKKPGSTNLKINLDGRDIEIKEQIQMYATNELLSHPLVSPVMQPSLGGLPPMLIQTGGGELLRDEQIYIAHKAANPRAYPASEVIYQQYDPEKKGLEYSPTYVQLQVWEDLCHVPHTLSFTRPAKYMYRSVAQFGAWALAHAQNKGIDIQNDDNVSIISSGDDDEDTSEDNSDALKQPPNRVNTPQTSVGKAGDPLPQFKDHMIRQRVNRHGVVYPLAPASELPALNMPVPDIGAIKPGPVRKWLAAKASHEVKFASEWKKIQAKREKEKNAGYEEIAGEHPPPTALAGRRRTGMASLEKKKGRSWGLAMWSGWGSSHDEQTLEREEKTEKNAEVNEEGDVVGGLNQTTVVPEGDGRGRSTVEKGRTSSNSRPSQPRRPWSASQGRAVSRGSQYTQVRDQGQMSDGQYTNSSLAERVAEGGAASAALAAGAGAATVAIDHSQEQQQSDLPSSPGTAPLMSVVSPTSEKLAHTENTFLSPSGTRPHNQEMAYPFKLQVAGRGASTVTLDSFAMTTATTATAPSSTAPSTTAPAPAPAPGIDAAAGPSEVGAAELGSDRKDGAEGALAAGSTAFTSTTTNINNTATTTNSNGITIPATTLNQSTVNANTAADDQQSTPVSGILHQRTSMLGSIGPDGMPMAHYEFLADGAGAAGGTAEEGKAAAASEGGLDVPQRPGLESFITASEGDQLKG